MRIEVEKRAADIITICDVCKVELIDKNTAYHAKEDHRHGVSIPGSKIGVQLTFFIGCYYDQRNLEGADIKGVILDGKIDLCKKCHKAVIQWYLDHLEPGSGI